jgi:hypothetical protein
MVVSNVTRLTGLSGHAAGYNSFKKEHMTRILPYIMITLSSLAAIVYLCAGDYHRAAYWAAAAVLNLSVTV